MPQGRYNTCLPAGIEEKRGNEGKDTGKLHEATRGTKWGRGEFDRGLSEVINYQEKDKNDIKKRHMCYFKLCCPKIPKKVIFFTTKIAKI